MDFNYLISQIQLLINFIIGTISNLINLIITNLSPTHPPVPDDFSFILNNDLLKY